MRRHDDEIARLLRRKGVVARRDHPELANSLRALVRHRRLSVVLPGIYADPAAAHDPRTRIQAITLCEPDAVIAGRAAAQLSFWPEIAVDKIDVLVCHDRVSRPGFCFRREQIPSELISEYCGVRITSPALTALDLACDQAIGGNGIDQALRQRAATLQQMRQALASTPRRRGNPIRAMLLHDSRDRPWSEAEREGHRLLRAGEITGWETNVAVIVNGSLFYVDIAFEALRIAIEIDGFAYHRLAERARFEADRFKWSNLTAAGWRVLHFTWRQLTNNPAWVMDTIVAALADARGTPSRPVDAFSRAAGPTGRSHSPQASRTH